MPPECSGSANSPIAIETLTLAARARHRPLADTSRLLELLQRTAESGCIHGLRVAVEGKIGLVALVRGGGGCLGLGRGNERRRARFVDNGLGSRQWVMRLV